MLGWSYQALSKCLITPPTLFVLYLAIFNKIYYNYLGLMGLIAPK
jgi:hypothetical protein